MATMGVISAAAATGQQCHKAAFTVKALSQICGVCETDGCNVSFDQWLDGDEAHISRLDEQNYCVVLGVYPRASGLGVQLAVQVYSRCRGGDPAKSRIEWPGGFSSPGSVCLGRAPGCSCDCILRGTMDFVGVPCQENLVFRFGGDGYSVARLGLASRIDGEKGLQDGSSAVANQPRPEQQEEGEDIQQPVVISSPALNRTVSEEAATVAPSGSSSSSSLGDSDYDAASAESVSQLALPPRADCFAEVLNVTVMSLDGCAMNSLRATPSDTVRQVKQRLAVLSGDDTGLLQLVYGCSRLKDSDTLGEFCAGATTTSSLMDVFGEAKAEEAPQPTTELVFHCIRLGRSSIASRFELLRDSADPNAQLAGSIADVADSVMQIESSTSDEKRPRPESILLAMPAIVRSRLIAWMIEAFDVLQFDCHFLFGTVLTLDRYCAAVAAPREQSEMGLALLAAICTEMKLARADIFPPEHMKRLLHHLCQGHFALEDILRTEYKMLTKLDFSMWVPSTLTFFGGLTLRFGDIGNLDSLGKEEQRWVWLAMMLLRIALLDVDTQYSFPHAILAAAALSGAMGVCEAAEEHREGLLQDLASYRPSSGFTDHDLVLECEERLLQLWSECTTGESPHTEFFGALEARFSSQTHMRVARLSPRARLAELRRLHTGREFVTRIQATSKAPPNDDNRRIHYNSI